MPALPVIGRAFAARILGMADLFPAKGLEPTSDGWRTHGRDPHFFLAHEFSPGWVRIRLKMTATAPGWAAMHADSVAENGDDTCLKRVEIQGAVDLDCFVYINHLAKGIRLYPPAGPGEIRLEMLRIEPLSGPQALYHAAVAKVKLARKYWQTSRVLGRGLAMLTRGDFAGLSRKLFQGLNGPDLEGKEPYDEVQAYEAWRASRRLTVEDRDRLRAEAAALSDPPLFSILLPTTGGTTADLRRSLDSICHQTYPNWELCIVCDPSMDASSRAALVEHARDEPRIRIAEVCASTGNSANAALALASGDYVALLDRGDELAEQAFAELARAIVRDRGLDMLYADEDRVKPDGRHVEPFFKPGWSPETLLSWQYTGRPGVYRTALVRRLGGFRADFGPAVEYDLVLRIAAESPHVARVPDVLYHRHAPADASVRAEEAALRSHLERTDRLGAVEPGATAGLHRVRFTVRGEPTVSIIIPSACKPVRIRDEKTFYLLNCLESAR